MVNFSQQDFSKLIYTAGIEAVGEWRDALRVRTHQPRVKLLISPFTPPYMPAEILGQNLDSIIQSLTFAKSRDSAGGTLTFTLAGDDRALDAITGFPLRQIMASLGRKPSIRDVLRPMTLISLYLDGYYIFMGNVRSVRKKTAKTGDGWTKTYTVVCDELGQIYNQNILADRMIKYGPNQNLMSNPELPLQLAGRAVSGTPTVEAFQLLVNAFLLGTLSYAGLFSLPLLASDGIPMAFRLIAQPSPYGGISNLNLLREHTISTSMFADRAGTSFWSYLKSLAGSPFMELFTETGGRTLVTQRVAPGLIGGPATLPAAIASTMTTLGTSVMLQGTGVAAQISPLGSNTPKVPTMGLGNMIGVPGFNYLVMRTTPFEIPWLGFTWWAQIYPFLLSVLDLLIGGDFIIITDDDITEKDLGTSDAQQFTMFEALFSGKSAAVDATVPEDRASVSRGPYNQFNPGGMKTFGARYYTAQIPFSHLGDLTGTTGQEAGKIQKRWSQKSWSSLVNTWFRNNHKFMEGTVTTRGIPYAKPGMLCLYLPSAAGTRVDDDRELGMYYIDNVTYQHNIGKAPRSTFSLIRGVPLPLSMRNMSTLLSEWEVIPPGINIFDGSA